MVATNNNTNTNDTEVKQDFISILPVISEFTSSSTNITEGQAVTFTDASSCSPDTWTWSFQGGVPSSFTGMNPPAITYPVAGVYPVSLTVTKGGASNTKTDNITVISCTHCTASYTDFIDEYISKVTVGTISKASTSSSYSDFTAISTDMEREAQVPVTITVTVSDNYEEHVILWIDWDQDCNFEGSEKTYLGDRVGSGDLSGVISVPAQAKLGKTRMRVAVQYDANPGACGTAEYGEVEDYTVNVKATLLPVTLTSFGGFAAELHNILKWTTESEFNFSYFDVEHSKDGVSFRKIGQVESLGDGGQAYVFHDKNPSITGYYRLRMNDLDGLYEYSEVISIKRQERGDQIFSVYPNPVGYRLNVAMYSTENKMEEVNIINTAGQVIQMRRIQLTQGLNKIDFEVFLIPSGNYVLKVGNFKPIPFVKNSDIKVLTPLIKRAATICWQPFFCC